MIIPCFNTLVANLKCYFTLLQHGKLLILAMLCFNVAVVTVRAQFGTLDPSFNLADLYGDDFGANALIRTIALQPDGKILIGGDFTMFDGIALNRIARLNPNGRIDTSFHIGMGAANSVNNIKVQADGKILIVGSFTSFNGTSRTRIARLNANGSLDTGFNPGTGADFNVWGLAIQPDGKIIIGGAFTTYNGSIRNRIARINTDGSIDLSFTPGFGANNTVYSLALQADGKILIGGLFTTYASVASSCIARINTDGTRDAGFNVGTGANNEIRSIVIQPDGKFFIGGIFAMYAGASRNGIARINADGSLDTSFDPGTGCTSVWGIGLQTDGKVVIGGDFTSFNGTTRNRIARVNSNGSLDTGYNPGTGINVVVNALVLQAEGKAIVGGNFTSYNNISRNRIALVKTDGSLDLDFVPSTGANNAVNVLALQPDGKILVGGNFTNYNNTSSNRIMRMNADGSPDLSFNSGTGPNGVINDIALLPDGKIIIVGSFTLFNGTTRNSIARLNADGSLDASFNASSGQAINTIAIQADGKILLGGIFVTMNSVTRHHIARLNADGSLDTGFAPTTNDFIHVIKVQSDGKILVGGDLTSFNGFGLSRIVRVNANGTRDATFSANSNARVLDIAIQPDGKIIIGGAFTTINSATRNYITRVNTNGSLDTSFVIGTGFQGMGSAKAVNAIALSADGKIITGGNFTSFNGRSRNNIAQLNANGSLDTLFSPGVGTDLAVNAVLISSNGQVIVGGNFSTYNNVVRTRIAKVNSSSILPVTWSHFEVKPKEQAALLTWGTSAELNNRGFNIEHSADGRNWKTIGFVSGHGNSSAPKEYKYLDEKPQQGANYYRLRQEDFNGRTKYSPIRHLEFGMADDILLYPNPLHNTPLNLQLPVAPGITSRWKLYASSGQLFQEGAIEHQFFSIPTERLSPGMYVLYVQHEQYHWQKRVVVQ
jgi:uncharacterized delta-60 repeat protein